MLRLFKINGGAVMLDRQYMIKDKKDLVRYLEYDRMALKKDYKRPRFMKDYEWRFQILLRKTEYWKNKNGFLKKIIYPYYLFKYKKISRLNCLEIPLNCIREGLTIWHLQNIIINDKCKIGYNFSISAGVIIGQAKERAPEIGNNVMLMVNTSVLGASICDNVAIGAGGLVIKDIDDEFTVWAGSPAKKISNNYPEPHMEKGKGIFKKIEEE